MNSKKLLGVVLMAALVCPAAKAVTLKQVMGGSKIAFGTVLDAGAFVCLRGAQAADKVSKAGNQSDIPALGIPFGILGMMGNVLCRLTGAGLGIGGTALIAWGVSDLTASQEKKEAPVQQAQESATPEKSNEQK